MIAQARRDFNAAEQWYRKSLEITERLGDKHGAARSYGQLGVIAGLSGNVLDSGQLLAKSIRAFLSTNDPHSAQSNAHNFMIFFAKATPNDQKKLKAIWQQAGLGEFPPPQED
jgi:hypothetical protein